MYYSFEEVKSMALKGTLCVQTRVFHTSKSNLSWLADITLFKKVDDDYLLVDCNKLELFDKCNMSTKYDSTFGYVYKGNGCGTERRFQVGYILFSALGVPEQEAIRYADRNKL